MTNFRCTRRQFRGMGPIWQMRELSCKNTLCRQNSFKGHYLPKSTKMPDKRRKNEKNRLFPQNQDSYNPEQKSLRQYCNIHIFLSFLGSLLKQCILFEIFLQFSLPPGPIQSWNSEKNSGYTRPTLFVGWGKGLDLCELETLQKCKSAPRLLSMIVD